LGTLVPVWEKYDRVCFDKEQLNHAGQVQADFVCPGHPLLDTVIDLILDKYRETLRAGAVLVDETDPGREPRVLFFLEQAIQDAGSAASGAKRVISREVHFVEIDAGGQIRAGGYAPYLDYRPATAEEVARIELALRADWLAGEALEGQVLAHAIEKLTPRHLRQVRERREAQVDKTLAAVHERLTTEINYWDKRAGELRQQEKSGKANDRLNAAKAQQRADELAARLERRKEELALYHLSSGTIKLSDFPGGERIAAEIGHADLPEANIAVLVGTALDPARPRQYPEVTVHTLWGELAYQLGGLPGYQMVEQADLSGVSPGSNTLKDLLFQFGPCLIIIDELVAYARNLYVSSINTSFKKFGTLTSINHQYIAKNSATIFAVERAEMVKNSSGSCIKYSP
jgi:hypothetical protein